MLGITEHLSLIRRHSTTSIMSSEVKNVLGNNEDKNKSNVDKQSKSAWGKVTASIIAYMP